MSFQRITQGLFIQPRLPIIQWQVSLETLSQPASLECVFFSVQNCIVCSNVRLKLALLLSCLIFNWFIINYLQMSWVKTGLHIPDLDMFYCIWWWICCNLLYSIQNFMGFLTYIIGLDLKQYFSFASHNFCKWHIGVLCLFGGKCQLEEFSAPQDLNLKKKRKGEKKLKINK